MKQILIICGTKDIGKRMKLYITNALGLPTILIQGMKTKISKVLLIFCFQVLFIGFYKTLKNNRKQKK